MVDTNEQKSFWQAFKEVIKESHQEKKGCLQLGIAWFLIILSLLMAADHIYLFLTSKPVEATVIYNTKNSEGQTVPVIRFWTAENQKVEQVFSSYTGYTEIHKGTKLNILYQESGEIDGEANYYLVSYSFWYIIGVPLIFLLIGLIFYIFPDTGEG